MDEDVTEEWFPESEVLSWIRDARRSEQLEAQGDFAIGEYDLIV